LAWSSPAGVWCHDFASRTTVQLGTVSGWSVHIPTLAFLPSGLLTLASRHGVHVINCADQSRTAAAPQSEGADCHAVSPDGRWLATGHAPTQDASGRWELALRVSDLAAWQVRSSRGFV